MKWLDRGASMSLSGSPRIHPASEGTDMAGIAAGIDLARMHGKCRVGCPGTLCLKSVFSGWMEIPRRLLASH
jgi:hypothetical protein